MAMLKKAIIQCPSDDVKNIGEVIGVIEVSEKGFGGIRAGKNQVIWDCSRYAVQPGDVWKDGVFYHDADYSDPAKYVPSIEEKLDKVEADFTEKDLDNKMAIAEVYEMLIGEGGVV